MTGAVTTIREHTIPPEVLNVLAHCACVGEALFIKKQLDRKMYDQVNKVLEALGGKWDRKAKGHIFGRSAADVVEQAILTGSYTKVKQDFGAFFTPLPLAERVVELARITPGMTALEPSAGQGNIAVAARDAGAFVMCVEMQVSLALELGLSRGFHNVVCADFVTHDFKGLLFDRVVMNPPFARRADIQHITRAHSLLKPGGRLVAIASASVLFRDDAMTRAFIQMVERNNGTIEPLPDGSFRESGTMVRTALVTMEAE